MAEKVFLEALASDLSITDKVLFVYLVCDENVLFYVLSLDLRYVFENELNTKYILLPYLEHQQ